MKKWTLRLTAAHSSGVAVNPTAPSPADPLHAHFMGRRAWHRVQCGHEVRLRGAGPADYAGETVDLSRGGALVAVTDAAFTAPDRDGMSLVEEHFPDGIEVLFPVFGITRRGKIVRATLQRGAHLALGISFEDVFTSKEALQLSIVAGETGVDEAAAGSLPYLPRPGVALSLVLEGVPEAVVGPLALGPVAALGERTVEARLTRDVDAIVDACASVPVGLQLVVGRDAVWAGRGTLVQCSPEADGCRVRLVAGTEFSRAVLKRMRAAPKASSA